MSLRPILTKSAAPAKKAPKPVDKTARVHPMLTDTSPLTRQVCAAANLPDVQALLLALAHPMTDEDQAALAKKAGGHPAHATRVKHLRELALKQHGDPTTEETTEKSFPRGDLAKGTFWRKVDAMDFGGIKRIPRAIRGHGMGSKGGKVFVNGAGHLQYGEAPPPFQAHVSFNEENEHESHAVSGLRLHGVSEQEAGNHLLYQTGDERHALALATAAKTGGHPHTIERVYREKAEEAQRQFRAHPMHHMDDLVEFDEAGRPVHDDVPVRRKVAEPVYDNDGVLKLNKDGSPKTKAISVDATERRPRYLIKRDKAGERKYTKANQPLDPVDVAKVLKVWNNLPKETRETDAKWYTGEAKHWIQQVAEASGQPFLKVAALLAAGNQAMGWETGQIIAAQQTFHDTMGITDAKGEPRYLQGRFPAINERIQRIATTPNNRRDLVEMVKREFATDKLGNFLMNMVGAGDGRAATVDRHMLGILGARVDSKGDYVASTHDMAYYRRVLLAAAHQAGTTPEGIQAATWVYFRNNGAKEKARANGQPEYLIGTVEKNKNLPTMRAYIAQRLAEAREAKAAPRPMRPRTAPATIAAKSFRSHLASRHDSVYSEDMGKSERVQSPGSRGGKGYWDGTGTWRYGQRPTEQAPEASRLPQEPTGHEAGPSGPPASSEPSPNV